MTDSDSGYHGEEGQLGGFKFPVSKYSVFDIETGDLGKDELVRRLPDFSKKIPKNYVDPQKKADWVKEKEREFLEDKCALDAFRGRIIMVNFLDSDGIIHLRHEYMNGDDKAAVPEKKVLRLGWEYIDASLQDGELVIGKDLFRFDLPMMIRRSADNSNRVTVPLDRVRPRFRGRRYWNECFYDVGDDWTCGVYGEYISLHQLAQHTGSDDKSGSGDNFSQTYYEDPTAAIWYAEQDLYSTEQAAEAFGVVKINLNQSKGKAA